MRKRCSTHPQRPGRRRVLKQLATSAVALGCPPLLAARGGPAPGPGSIQELADLFRLAPADKVFDLAAEQIRRGATLRQMLGGVLMAGVQDVEPRPPGTKHHAVLMVPSVLELASAAEGADVWLPVFFNLQVLKDSQEWDREEGDWVLPPAPKPLTDDPARARAALVRAIEDHDTKTADRAATAALGLMDLDAIFELLWPAGARDFVNVGHQMIHVSQGYRALAMMGGAHREEVVRSMVYGLADYRDDRTLASYRANRVRIAEMSDGWDAGKPDPDASTELMRALRRADSDGAARLVLELVGRGVAPDSIWDGIRIAASELLYRQRVHRVQGEHPGRELLLAVHPLTTTNAFHFAWSRTPNDETRRLLLLQATSWIPLFRDALTRIVDLSMEGPGFDALEPAKKKAKAAEVIEQASIDYERSAALTLRAVRKKSESNEFMEGCRKLMGRKATSAHHHKYCVAAFEEFAKADPRWSPHLLATCLSYLPRPGDEDSDVYRRTRKALMRV